MSAIIELALSSLFQVLFQRLTSPDLAKIFHQGKIELSQDGNVADNTCSSGWCRREAVTNKLVKVWLDELRDLAYDVEDNLDSLVLKLLWKCYGFEFGYLNMDMDLDLKCLVSKSISFIVWIYFLPRKIFFFFFWGST